MQSKYHYFMSAKNERKHEISRKEFVKLFGESSHCVDTRRLYGDLYMSIANYDKAERKLRNAQRSGTSTIWSCGHYTLYLEIDHKMARRMRDSAYPD